MRRNYTYLNKIKYLIIFLIFTVFALPATAADSWYSLETDNFIINFKKDNSSIAYQAADIVEEVHQKLVPFMQYRPEAKTHIIINDNNDLANGSADPFYFNRIYIYTHQPDIYSGMVGYYQSWLRLLITHEYTHILHLNINHGATAAYRRVLGKIPFLSTPNFMQPWWMIEGYTTFVESKFTSGGRGDNDIYNMFLRTAASEGKLYSLDQVNGKYDLTDWPSGGQSIYIYGLSIFKYIAEQYGEDKLVRLSHEFSTSPQYGLDAAFENVLGIGVEELYQDWYNQQIESSKRLRARIENKGLTTVKKITELGWYTISPDLSPKGEIAYIHYGNKFPALRVIDSQGRDRQIRGLLNSAGERLSWSKDGEKLVYPALDSYQYKYRYYDLYLYDFEEKKETRITRGERAYSPAWINQQEILYLTQSGGITNLKKLNLKTGEKSILMTGGLEESYSHLSVSADGTKALLSLWKNGSRDIYLYSLADHSLQPLVRDQYINIYPVFSADSKYIIYSSDRNGIFNLYALSLQTGQLYQVTNLYTGAFEPQVKDNQEIIFVGYSGEGFDLYSVDYDQEQWLPLGQTNPVSQELNIDNKVEQINQLDYYAKIAEQYRVYNYNPLQTLAPRYILPNISYTADSGGSKLVSGLTTGGIDALQHHTYQLTFNYDSQLAAPQYNFVYLYQGEGRLSSQIKLEQQVISDNDDWANTDLVERDYQLDLLFGVSKNNFLSRQILLGTGYHEQYSPYNGEKAGFQSVRAGWESSRTSGYNNIVNNSYLGLTGEWIPAYQNGQDWKAELTVKDVLSLGKGNNLAGKLLLGTNKFSRYQFQDYSPIRISNNNYTGSKIAVLNLEYRKELLNLEQGMGIYPIFYDDLNATIFYDLGLIGEDPLNYQQISVYGAELGLEISQLYGLFPMELILGISFNSEDQQQQIYFRLGKQF